MLIFWDMYNGMNPLQRIHLQIDCCIMFKKKRTKAEFAFLLSF